MLLLTRLPGPFDMSRELDGDDSLLIEDNAESSTEGRPPIEGIIDTSTRRPWLRSVPC